MFFANDGLFFAKNNFFILKNNLLQASAIFPIAPAKFVNGFWNFGLYPEIFFDGRKNIFIGELKPGFTKKIFKIGINKMLYVKRKMLRAKKKFKSAKNNF
jgi:hypothetical protein